MAVVVLVLVPFILATLTIGSLADTAIEQSRRARMADVAQTLADAVDREFERAQILLVALAASPGADEGEIARTVNRARIASELLGARIVLRRPPSPTDAPSSDVLE